MNRMRSCSEVRLNQSWYQTQPCQADQEGNIDGDNNHAPHILHSTRPKQISVQAKTSPKNGDDHETHSIRSLDTTLIECWNERTKIQNVTECWSHSRAQQDSSPLKKKRQPSLQLLTSFNLSTNWGSYRSQRYTWRIHSPFQYSPE